MEKVHFVYTYLTFSFLMYMEQNAPAVLHYYKGSFRRALASIYPNISLKFEFHDSMYTTLFLFEFADK